MSGKASKSPLASLLMFLQPPSLLLSSFPGQLTHRHCALSHTPHQEYQKLIYPLLQQACSWGLQRSFQLAFSFLNSPPPPPTPSRASSLTPTVLSTMHLIMSTIDYIPTPAGLTPTMQILMSTIDYIPTPACLTPTMHLLMSTTDDIPTPPACLQLWGLQGSF